MEVDKNERNYAQGKRWRDSRDFQHDADSATSPFSSLFLISKIENVGDGDENAILAFNEPCDGSDFTRRRKKPRVENDILPTAPAGIHHHQSMTTSKVSHFRADENKPPGVEWWRQRPARNDTFPHSTSIGCFVCTKPNVPQQAKRQPLKPNTLLNYFATYSASAGSASPTQQSHVLHSPLLHDDQQLLQTCTFCDRSMCRMCTRVCQVCRGDFCTLCSMLDYQHSGGDHSYCLDCRALQTSTTDNPEHHQQHGDSMQLD